MAFGQQDVLRFHIAVQYTMPMGAVQRFGDIPGDLQSLGYRQLALPVEATTQRLPVHKGHDIVQQPTFRARIKQWQDVGVLQGGGDTDFVQEPLGTERGRDFWAEDLEGDRAMVLEILNEPDRSHPAFAELPLGAVTVPKDLGESLLKLRHQYKWGTLKMRRGRTARQMKESRSWLSPCFFT
jgi:hypothetical protein